MGSKREAVQNNDVSSESDDEKFASQYLCNSPGFMNVTLRRQFLQHMVKMLPSKMQHRITALKNLQLEQIKIEAEFFDEVYNLERKFLQRYQPLYDKRRDIICGNLEPAENEEPKWKSDPEEDATEMSEKLKEITLQIKKDLQTKYTENDKGIPDFWLTIFRNSELLSEMIQEHDEPVFKKLRDIKIVYKEDMASYILEFHFDKNEYFSNSVLTKQYFLKHNFNDSYPWGFDGPEIEGCVGCTINWEKGMNLTMKTIRKKQKHKERGAVRTITKQVPNDSFFNFFNPPEIPEDKSKIDEDIQGILATDFEIGHFLRSRVIPRAVLFYTGDIVDDDEDDDYDVEDEDDDDEEEDDEDDEDGEGRTGGGGQKNLNKKMATPNECPNQ